MKYPNTLYSALLFTSLIVPFALRVIAPALEPYPAVLLPSGAGRIHVAEAQIDLGRTGIYGRTTGRQGWTPLFPPRFLYPLPPQSFPPLAQRYFGLSPVELIANVTKVGVRITINTRPVGQEKVDNAKQWLQAILNESGCDDNVLRITQEVITVRKSDGAEIAVRYQNDKVFNLR